METAFAELVCVECREILEKLGNSIFSRLSRCLRHQTGLKSINDNFRKGQSDANKIAIFNKNSNGFLLLLRPNLTNLRPKNFFGFTFISAGTWRRLSHFRLNFSSIAEDTEQLWRRHVRNSRISPGFSESLRLISSRSRINFETFSTPRRNLIKHWIHWKIALWKLFAVYEGFPCPTAFSELFVLHKTDWKICGSNFN